MRKDLMSRRRRQWWGRLDYDNHDYNNHGTKCGCAIHAQPDVDATTTRLIGIFRIEMRILLRIPPE